jgi:Flp pilus assembly protein CpaB
VNDVTSVNGFAVPGARVDVLATGNVRGSEERSTITLLQNIAVLASGQKIERSATGEPQNATVVTLLVALEDAEKLALDTQEAHIQLVLRQPARHEERETRNCRKENPVWQPTVKTPSEVGADKTCSDRARN